MDLRKCPNGAKMGPQMRATFRVKSLFLGTNFETLRQTGAKRRRIPKIIHFS